MKRHVQEPGVRKWSGNDLLELQGEGLAVADGFFSQYGNCVICGCQVKENSIAAGLVSIGGMVLPLQAVETVEVFPVYLVKAEEHIQREYADDVVRDIAVKYFAKVVQVKPEDGDCIEIQDAIELLKQADVEAGKRITALEKKMPSYLDHIPTVNDDGYDIGVEVWTVDEYGNKTFWKCHDNTKGKAVWKRTGEGSGGGGSHSGAVYLTGQTNFTKASIIIKEGYLK